MRSYYRQRLLLLLASLGEAYVGQLGRMMRLPHSRVMWLLEGNPERGYSRELALVALELAREKVTPAKRGRAFEITPKGRRKARSITSAKARRVERPASAARAVGRVQEGLGVRWGVPLEGVSGDGASVSWSHVG